MKGFTVFHKVLLYAALILVSSLAWPADDGVYRSTPSPNSIAKQSSHLAGDVLRVVGLGEEEPALEQQAGVLHNARSCRRRCPL